MLSSPLSRLVALVLLMAPIVGPTAVAAEPSRTRVMKVGDLAAADPHDVNRLKARETREQAISMLVEMIKSQQPSGATRAEMFFRLAELEMEEAKDLSLDEHQAYIDEIDRCANTKGCNPDSIQESTFTVGSTSWRRKAVSAYCQVLDADPRFARGDEVLFGQASAYSELGQDNDATTALTTLVRTWPDSRLLPDAYVLIGESAFEAGDLPRATLAYKRAAAYKEADIAPFAAYKLAWCLYNTGDLDATINTMKGVVAMGGGQVSDEALRDLTRFFAEAGQVREAEVWLASVHREDLISVTLQRMGEVHLEQGRYSLAIETWGRLIARDPMSPRAPLVQSDIVGAWRKVGDREAIGRALLAERRMVASGSEWARTNTPEALAAGRERLEKDLRSVAVAAHDEGRRIGTGPQAVAAYALASASYQAWVDEFPQSEHAADMRYAYGELLYKLKRYDEAFAQYNAVLDIDPKGEHARFCAEAAVYTAQEILKGQPPTAGDNTLSDAEKRLVAATDRYVALFPKGEKVKAFTYKSAYTLYNKNQLAEASTRFRAVIAMDPGSNEAEQAANLILDSFNLAGDWTHLEEVALAFYQQPGLGGAAFKTEVHGVYENARLKRIEVDLASSGQKRPAADAWVAFAKELPSSSKADLALNNAAATYDQLGDLGAAMATRQELVDQYKNSRFYNGALLELAAGHEALAEFDVAAAGYEAFFQRAPTDPRARDALYTAAFIRRVLGQTDPALNDYQRLITAFPADPMVADLTLTVGRLYEDSRRWDRAAGVYQTMMMKPPQGASFAQVFEARMRYGESLEHQPGQEAKAARHWQDTLAVYEAAARAGEDLEPVVDRVGELRFRLAQPTVDRALALTIEAPRGRVSRATEDAALKASLTAKAKAIQEAEAALQGVIQTRSGEWGLAAIVQLGRLYENMAATLEHSPVPSYLTPEQAEMYGDRVRDGVYAQNQKAIQAYDLALQRSFELSLYNPNASTALARLNALDPVEHAPTAERIKAASYASAAVVRPGPIEQP